MSTLAIRDGDNVLRYLDMEGAGDSADPFLPRQRMIEVMAASIINAQVQVATAGQIVQLPTFPITRGVLLKALSSNSGQVYLGGSAVSSTTGFELDKNESVLVRIDQLNKLYITTTANNEGICLLGI